MEGCFVVTLSDTDAQHVASTGAKAANLARAAAAGFPTVPGFVITTAGVAAGIDDHRVADEVRRAFDELCGEPPAEFVVRSSSAIEDTGDSSMAGRFTSVLGVAGWDDFVDAVRAVIESATAVRDASGAAGSMAVLVQRQLAARCGGVMFGVDPVTGNTRHVVVEVVPSGPEALVGGVAVADHYVLTRHGRTEQATIHGQSPQLDRALRRALTRMARKAERVFGAPQDIEWLVDPDDRLWLLQSRPVTAIAATDDQRDSVVLGPGPLAETFPAPLGPLEDDLWIPPLREGITRALRTAGAVSSASLDRSPVVTTVGGWAAADLELIGVVEARTSLRRRIDPTAILRRLATAWRVGRLRVAMPGLARDLVATVDRDLAAIPRLDTLTTDELVDLLDRARRELATVHSYEVLAGMLMIGQGAPSGAAVALRELHDARTAGWDDDEIVSRSPIVLALTPPSLGGPDALPAESPAPSGPAATLDQLDQREALRVRARWLQELLGRAADELGRRLVGDGTLPDVGAVGDLGLSELVEVAGGGPPPSDLAERAAREPGPPLPVSFRLTVAGDVLSASVSSHTRPPGQAAGIAAGGGRAVGVAFHRAHHGTPPEGAILVTRHLEPQLATVLDRLGGLVSETGSTLSHLAILAREANLPTVVGVPDALRRFPDGSRLMIDGRTGEVEVIEMEPEHSPTSMVEP
ncbi:MAG: PEP/pyruvate-binding domain-containing protein [Ilumatobacteraceae bacterium]